MNIDERILNAFGKDIFEIANEWTQLTSQDILELYELGIQKVHAVYDNWKEIAREHLNRGDADKYIIPFIDMDALADYISKTEKDDWIELKSKKLICGE